MRAAYAVSPNEQPPAGAEVPAARNLTNSEKVRTVIYYVRLYFRNGAFEKDYRFLQKKLPNREIWFDSTTTDETTWLITAASDTEPGEKYLFDRKSKKLELQYRVREKLPREALAELKPIRYKSSDGLEIPAYLALPRGLAPKNLPTVTFRTGDLGHATVVVTTS